MLCPYSVAEPQPHVFFYPGQNHPGDVQPLSIGPPGNIQYPYYIAISRPRKGLIKHSTLKDIIPAGICTNKMRYKTELSGLIFLSWVQTVLSIIVVRLKKHLIDI